MCGLRAQSAAAVAAPSSTNGEPSGTRKWWKKGEEFVDYLTSIPEDRPAAFTRALVALGREHQWWFVAAVFKEMLRREVQPNRIHCNAAIGVFMKCRRPHNAKRLLVWLEKQQMEPNEVSYTGVVLAFAQAGKISMTERWLLKMMAQGLNPSEAAHSALVSACLLRGDLQRAAVWIGFMRRTGVTPSPSCVKAIMTAAVHQNDHEKMQKSLALMEAAGLILDRLGVERALRAVKRAQLPETTSSELSEVLSRSQSLVALVPGLQPAEEPLQGELLIRQPSRSRAAIHPESVEEIRCLEPDPERVPWPPGLAMGQRPESRPLTPNEELLLALEPVSSDDEEEPEPLEELQARLQKLHPERPSSSVARMSQSTASSSTPEPEMLVEPTPGPEELEAETNDAMEPILNRWAVLAVVLAILTIRLLLLFDFPKLQ